MSNWAYNGKELMVSTTYGTYPTTPSKPSSDVRKHPRTMALADLGKQPTAVRDVRVGSDLYESWIHGLHNGVLVHRGEEYVIGENISDDAANMIVLAQWIGGNDHRLDFAHQLLVAWLEHAQCAAELSGDGNANST